MPSGSIIPWQIDGETMETVTDLILLCSNITADGDCSHETKRHLLLGKKAMTELDTILKSRDITLLINVHLVKVLVFPVAMYQCESWTIRKLSTKELMLLNCGVGEDFWESLGLQGDSTSPSKRKSVLNILWKDWCWSWKANTLAPWCEELTHLKRPWCWEIVKAGGEEDDRAWRWFDGITSPSSLDGHSLSKLWTGKPGVVQSMGLQRVRHDWVTELNWRFYDLNISFLMIQGNL